jgi:hypothetical protein
MARVIAVFDLQLEISQCSIYSDDPQQPFRAPQLKKKMFPDERIERTLARALPVSDTLAPSS